MIIEEFKEHVKVLRGTLKRNGINYEFINSDSILLKILKNDEFAPLEEILRETKRRRKQTEKSENYSSENDDSEDSGYDSENTDEFQTDSLKRDSNLIEERQKNDVNKNKTNEIFQKRKTKVFRVLEENSNGKLLACDTEELSIKYQELERKYKTLINIAGNKILKLENRRNSLKNETNQVLEEIKQEAIKELNEIIDKKSKEISSLAEKIEEMKIQIIKKETEMNKKLLDAQKENNSVKFNFKKLEIENNSLNEFINTYQSDILLLQSKIEKKSNF